MVIIEVYISLLSTSFLTGIVVLCEKTTLYLHKNTIDIDFNITHLHLLFCVHTIFLKRYIVII